MWKTQQISITIRCKLSLALFLKMAILPENMATKNSSPASQPPLPIVPLCLLKCKDNHMVQMESEWSSNFVFPLNGLLRSGASSEQMSERVKQLCRHNSELANCLQECPTSVENEIMQMGLEPWQGICLNIRDMQTQFGCWKTNIDAILLACSLESQKLRYDIESFTRNVSVKLVESICIDLSHLSNCFVGQYGQYCGRISQKLIGTLFESSRVTIVKMLRIKWNDEVPSKCGPNAVKQTNVEFWSSKNGTSAASSENFIKQAYHSPFFVANLIFIWSFLIFKLKP